jgi:arylsulfatase A-like enzyme
MGERKKWDIVAIAAWFGLVTGLLEGVVRIALQSLGLVSFDLLLSATSLKVLWVAPAFYVLLFSLVGFILAMVYLLAPRVPVDKAAVFLFSFVGFQDVLSSSGRLRSWSVVILALGLATAVTRWFNDHQESALRFWRRSLVAVAALALVAFAGVEAVIRWEEQSIIAGLPAPPSGAPNVLVIVIDTARKDHFSSYGYSRKTSPNLDRIAEQSVQFETAIAPSAWTLPSHASMLTGLYPSGHGAERLALDKGHLVLPEALQTLGYRTAAFSANTLLFNRGHGFGRGFARFEDSFHNVPDMIERTTLGRRIREHLPRRFGLDDVPGRKTAAEVTQETLSWVNQNDSRPFFAFLNYFDLHDPYLPPQPYRGRFSKRPNPGGVFNSFAGRNSWRLFTPQVLEDEVAAYDGGLAYVDDMIGQLIGDLDRRGLGRNTIVVITADHGESFGEHGIFGHQTSLYPEQIRVPLWIRWPDKIPAGVKIQAPVSLTDLPATVMDLVASNTHHEFPGRSLAQTWKDSGAQADWPSPASELAATPEETNPKVPAKYGYIKALLSPTHYLILYQTLGTELFERQTDPNLLRNLAKDPESAELVSKLREDMQRSLARATNRPTVAMGQRQ